THRAHRARSKPGHLRDARREPARDRAVPLERFDDGGCLLPPRREVGLVDRHAELLLAALALLGESALRFLAERFAGLARGLAQDAALRFAERLPAARVDHDVEDLEILVGARPVLGELDILL